MVTLTTIVLFMSLYFFTGSKGIAEGRSRVMAAPETCSGEPKTTAGRLKKSLFCGYDSSVRPVLHHNNQTVLQLLAFPVEIMYTKETRNGLWMAFWMYMEWNDELLRWNSSDYEGINSIDSDGTKIWSPDISITDPPQSLGKQMSCRVESTGSVNCVMNPTMSVHCDIDLTYYPYDKHQCRLAFSSRTYRRSELDFNFIDLKNGVNPYQFYRRHGYYKLGSLTAVRNITILFKDIHIVELVYRFTIERQSPTHVVLCASPAFVMMAMVLAVFWLEVQCSARVILSALSVLAHLMVLQFLNNIIAPNAQSPPVIIIFFRDSLLLTAIALVWSVAARSLSTSPSSPYWLYIISTHLNNNNVAKILLPQDVFIKSGASGDEDESSLVVHRDCVEQQWRILTLLSDRLLFGFFSLVYMFMYIRLIP